jgi:NADH-quinone oxidoreductase subunit G
MPIYSVDALVRRADALQNTRDAKITKTAHINAKLASQLNVNETSYVQVKQDEIMFTLAVTINDQLPDNAVLIYAGQNVTTGWHGQVELSATTEGKT